MHGPNRLSRQPIVTVRHGVQLVDAYYTCELATLSKDGSPVAWPTSGLRLDDGTFLLTTSLGYPQKAYNIRRDGRMALLFSDPTASGLNAPEQILVRGVATCPDDVRVDPVGDLGRLWALLMRRQPASRKYLNWPTNKMADFYYMRLLITVKPQQVVTADEKGWLLRPERVIEPGRRHRASVLDPIRIGRECQARTRRYLERRGLPRPSIPWEAYRAIRAGLPKS